MTTWNIFEMEPLMQILFSLLYVGEGFSFMFLSIIIKNKIKWGHVDKDNFNYAIWGSLGITCVILYLIDRKNFASINPLFPPISTLAYFFTWFWAFWLSASLGVWVFNKMNKEYFTLTLQRWEDVQENVTEIKLMVYKEHEFSNRMVAIRLNEKQEEPLKDLIKRIFGIKKYIEISTGSHGWTLNRSGKIYLYRRIMINKKNRKLLQVIAEPNLKNIGMPAFVKQFEGYLSTTNELERVQEENINLRMCKDHLASISGRNEVAPFIRLFAPEQYTSWKGDKETADKLDKEEIDKIEKKIKEAKEEKEENKLEKDSYTELEAEDLKFYEEEWEDYAW